MNAIGGCCGSSPEHIAAIREMALAYPPRQQHGVAPLMRLSGLEPLNYEPDESNMRRTFLNIGERCNVAGSIIYKKAIVDGDYDKAVSIALSQVRLALRGRWGGHGNCTGAAGPVAVCTARHAAVRLLWPVMGCLVWYDRRAISWKPLQPGVASLHPYRNPLNHPAATPPHPSARAGGRRRRRAGHQHG